MRASRRQPVRAPVTAHRRGRLAGVLRARRARPLLPFLHGSNSLALGIIAVALFLAVWPSPGSPGAALVSGLRPLALEALAVEVAYGIGRVAGSVV